MSEQNKKSTVVAPLAAESQKQRWLKYGANVTLTVIVVILLAGVVVYLFQRNNKRWDMTYGGNYSLKPQTVQLVEKLAQKVKLVGLFTKTRHEEQEKKVDDQDNPAVRYQQVADLLQEYQQKAGSGKVSVEMIDPIAEPAKVDALFNEVAKKYGNDINKYQDVLNAYPKTVEEINRISKEEMAALTKLVEDIQKNSGGKVDRKVAEAIQDVVNTVAGFPPILKLIQEQVKKQLELKVPDYQGAVGAIKGNLDGLQEEAGGILDQFKSLAGDPKTPESIKAYIKASTPRFEALKKAADDLMAKTQNLGQLKQLDDLRTNKSNTIAVMGETDMKVIPSASLFPPNDARAIGYNAGDKPRQRFAGEQQVTTALYTLANPGKRKVAFVRSGGPPMAARMPFGGGGAFALVADRLRDVDFEVLDKDISGQWAMQAQMQRMPMPPEPSDEQLKDAIWVVLDFPVDPQAMMQNPSVGQLGNKVSEHLKAGGSAMVLVYPGADNLSSALGAWGIDTKPDHMLVHEKPDVKGARSEDFIADQLREQPIFLLNKYGDHALTRPIQSLDGVFVPVIPVSTRATAGIKLTNLLPIPETPKAWAERNPNENAEGKPFEFNPGKDGQPGDIGDGPFYGGAVAENDKGQRLAVYGNLTFASNEMFRFRDPKNPGGLRFPGNGELFINTVYWLAKMDSMIAISPTALEVPRVAPMSDATLGFWRLGVMIIGMPVLVLAAGTFVYLKRRD